MDDDDEVTGWLAGVFTLVALPFLAVVALRLLSAKVLSVAGGCLIRIGYALLTFAYYLNDR